MANGECHVPKGCPCKSNEQYNDEKQICEPICNGMPCNYYHMDAKECTVDCENSDCDGNHCLCWSGYHKGETPNKCEPTCRDPFDEDSGCMNGKCILPGICKCYEGFNLSINDSFTCVEFEKMASGSEEIRFYSSSFNLYLILIVIGIVLVIVCLSILYRIFRRPKHPPKIHETLQENLDFFTSPYFISEPVKGCNRECDKFL